MATPLFIAAALKIDYDLMLYAALNKAKPPEEPGARRRVPRSGAGGA